MTVHPRLRRQLCEMFSGTLPDLPQLQALIDAVSRDYASADERCSELEDQLASLTYLDSVVAERTTQIDLRNHEMALILDNAAQGYVTAQLDGSLSSECSRAMVEWFGPPAPDTRIWSYLAGDDAALAAWIQLAFDSLCDPEAEHDVALEQLPRRLERAGRLLEVEYRSLGEPRRALLVVVSDLTDELERQRADAAQRELLAIVERAHTDRASVTAFVRDADELVRHAEHSSLPAADLQRKLHTLKGNAALLGATSIADACHELETAIEIDQAIPDRAAWATLRRTWQALHERIDRVLDVSERRAVVVDWDEYQAVLASIGDAEPWAARIRGWSDDGTRSQLLRFAEHAQDLARRLGKAELDVEVRDNGVRVDGERLAPVWSAVVHAVTNAVDHGIERGDDRIATGKPPRARMVLSTELRSGELVIEIRDDGRGIDWRAVARRAAALGMPAVTHRELCDALFASGVSTAPEVTRYSGRGVGMSALYVACAELGGRVEVVSEMGRGATVRCVVPITCSKRNSLLYYDRAAASSSR